MNFTCLVFCYICLQKTKNLIKSSVEEMPKIIKMPKAGLEPAWISPYAPETHVSTIPPLRHNTMIQKIIFNFQFFYMHSVVDVDSRSILSENDT